ncbi:MAG: hypothetical protein MUP99_06395, partial [Pedobacter sp.]|nr:hypothetical protein [Pedobacter sp.]
MNTYPLISCICIAHGKPAFFDKAFECFQKQNYPNKELLIAYQKKDYYTQSVIEQFNNRDDMKILGLPYCSKDLLDDTIKHAVVKCTGFYICNWKEDGWHHESRLSYQYNSM